MPPSVREPKVTTTQGLHDPESPPRVRAFRAPVDGGAITGWISGEGPPILLLHGGPGLSEYLADLAAELSGGFTVARYQQRGLEPSVVSGDRTVDGHVADAIAVMDALNWPTAWVVGHSWGGHLAMHVAVAHPERTDALVSIDTLGAVPDGGAAALGENLMRPLAPDARARMEEINASEERGETTESEQLEALGILWPYYFAEPHKAPPMPPIRMDVDGHHATWSSVNAHFEGGRLESALALFRRPSLFIHGELDPIPVEECRRTAALVPGARLEVIPGCGHFPWIERPGLLLEMLLSFQRG